MYNQLIKKLNCKIVPSVESKDSPYAVQYYPCGVELKDSRKLDCVSFIDREGYYRHWGDSPKDRLFLDLGDVSDIFESVYRLSPELAQKLYDIGETGMGFFRFVVVMNDDKRFTYVTGNLVDFLEPPDGYQVSDIIDVLPGESTCKDWRTNHHKPKKYYWCLVDDLKNKVH